MLGGLFRQWSVNGKLTVPEQVKQIEVFCNQINRAAQDCCKVIVTGDVNLWAEKWQSEDFDQKSVAQPLLQISGAKWRRDTKSWIDLPSRSPKRGSTRKLKKSVCLRPVLRWVVLP